MKEYDYTSAVAPYIRGFIGLKRALGYKYDVEAYVLHRFDVYWVSVNGNMHEITKESLDGWVIKKDCEGESSHSQRINVVKQLCIYVNGLGTYAHIPRDRIRKKRPVVHVLTVSELKQLFTVVDSYCPVHQCAAVNRMSFEYRVILRLMLMTGLRRSETVSIRLADIDAGKRTIVIYNAKGRKDRIICYPEEMAALLSCYMRYMESEDCAGTEWLFPSQNPAMHMSPGGLGIKFREFWKQTGFAGSCEKNPTLHSLRHTFVVMRMNSWMKAGTDLNVMMPYLSRFLGHKSPDETFYYYHLVADAFNTIREKDRLSSRVIPEVRIR